LPTKKVDTFVSTFWGTVHCDSFLNSYYYQSGGDSTYTISFCLGGQVSQLDPGPKCLTPGGIVSIDCAPSCLNDDTGCSWSYVGSSSFSTGAADNNNLIIDNNIPYVAYVDVANGNRLSVQKYNGSSWEYVGGPGFSGESQEGSMDFFVENGTPYVAYAAPCCPNQVFVMKYDGLSWISIGSNLNDSGGKKLSLAVVNSVPYVSFSNEDLSLNGRASVKTYNGSSWEYLGGTSASSDPIGEIDLTSSNGELYIVYMEDITFNVVVKKFNGTSWESVGNSDISGGHDIFGPNLVFNNQDLYLSYRDASDGNVLVVKKLNGTNWESLSQPSLPTGPAYWPSLKFYNNSPFVAFLNYDSEVKTSLMKYDGSSWNYVGGNSFGPGYVGLQSLFINNGVPYIAFSEVLSVSPLEFGKISVMKLSR
ncbi:MAG: hypothetical protein WCJ57_04665, partial [Candidatus Falkowbacteria bacterium]